MTCKALYEYRTTQPDELTFPKDAIITNVIKQDGGWWQGDYGEKKAAWLPSNYVEEVCLCLCLYVLFVFVLCLCY